MKEKVVTNMEKILKIIYMFFAILFVIFIAKRQLSNFAIFIATTIMFITFIFLVKKGIVKFNKKMFITLIITAFFFRIGIFFLDYSHPLVDDYLFFYENATNFANGYELNNRYIATFPFLAPYVILLGGFFKLCSSNNYLLVVLLNNILDIITAIVIYKILSKKDQKTGQLGLLLWLINPINIIWTTICCPVVVVNTGITISLYFFVLMKNNINNSKKFLTLSMVYGIVIGVFNNFRPIMIIIIIATIMYYFYNIIKLRNKKNSFILITSILLILISYKSINMFLNYSTAKFIKQEVSTTPGWTLYLGSNIKNKGMWNKEASEEYTNLFNDNNYTAQDIQEIFKQKALEQYQENGIKNITLFTQKFIILLENIQGYSYYNFISKVVMNNKILAFAIRFITEISMIIIILLNIYCYKYLDKDVQNLENMLIYLLIIMGIAVSHIFVEVSSRYMLPLMPTLIITATYSLSNILTNEE